MKNDHSKKMAAFQSVVFRKFPIAAIIASKMGSELAKASLIEARQSDEHSLHEKIDRLDRSLGIGPRKDPGA